jgi:hypothetical protein
VYDEDKRTFAAIQYPVTETFTFYKEGKGIESDAQLMSLRTQYNDNK